MSVRAGLPSLAAALLLASPGIGGEKRFSKTLGIATEFECVLPERAERAMREEVSSLFRIGRLRIVWEKLEDAAGQSVHDHMVVVRFRGRCGDGRGKAAERTGPALAFTHVTNGHVLPFAEVDCDRVHVAVSRVVRLCHGPEMEMSFGRALARVAGHEIYHMLTRTRAHGVRGLAKPLLTPQELIEDNFRFDPPDFARIRDALFGGTWASAHTPPASGQ